MNSLLITGLLAVAVSGAVNERPVITLDLNEAVLSTQAELCLYQQEWTDLVGGNLSTSMFPNAPAHCGSNLLAKTCEVFSTPQTCAEPQATGFDHHEGKMQDANGDSLVNKDYVQNVRSPPGTFPPQKIQQSVAGVNYQVRGEYLIQYSVSDTAGNEAENIHFAMIIDDSVPPSLANAAAFTEFTVTLESNFQNSVMTSIYALPGADIVVNDAYDGHVTSTRGVVVTGTDCVGGDACSSSDDNNLVSRFPTCQLSQIHKFTDSYLSLSALESQPLGDL
jgi:hypothetical protein